MERGTEPECSDLRPTVKQHQPTIECRTHGVARIKKEFVLEKEERGNGSESEPPTKKQKKTGRNQKRPIHRNLNSEKICPSIIREKECSYGESCKFCHNLEKFMSMKPPDIADKCYVFEKFGFCPQGVACRYGGKHINADLKNVVNNDIFEETQQSFSTVNFLDKTIQKLLWKKKYDFTKANSNVNIVQNWYHQRKLKSNEEKEKEKEKEGVGNKDDAGNQKQHDALTGCSTDEELIRLRPAEIKKVNFSGKLYLAPLTTVGNLPFRRLCKSLGADITCSEMAVATNLLQASQSEWALLKRHSSEDVFGIQLCGAYPDTLSRCAQLLTDQTSVDFVDINCGCPIDLVYKRGEGSALISKPNRLEQIIRSMTTVMNVPLTIKMRTGIVSDKPLAHTLIPKLKKWGVAQVTLHGRSREQRYTRLADWDYIEHCAKVASPIPLFGNGDVLSYEDYYEHLQGSSISGIMVARGALIKPWIFTEIKEQRHWDISSSERFDLLKDFVNFGLEHWGSDQQGVENVRRFLLEQLSFSYRPLQVLSGELRESSSQRYIPVGVMERLPQYINARPPPYRGRDNLETLLASPDCTDWIKIRFEAFEEGGDICFYSEMLLGPVPANYDFLPKHKANSYK